MRSLTFFERTTKKSFKSRIHIIMLSYIETPVHESISYLDTFSLYLQYLIVYSVLSAESLLMQLNFSCRRRMLTSFTTCSRSTQEMENSLVLCADSLVTLCFLLYRRTLSRMERRHPRSVMVYFTYALLVWPLPPLLFIGRFWYKFAV